ncbi:hypothetical protein [Nannocystis pusilla]|uniref:hypothetical protein n=1 Tax=Nannocystis pusilla TaxID=889268 RepID=UPI003DA48F52
MQGFATVLCVHGEFRGNLLVTTMAANERPEIRIRRPDSPFLLGVHFDRDNVVEIAKSQFPVLEAQVAMHSEAEKTKRLLIVVAAVCVLAGSVMIVLAPIGKEGVSYAIAAVLSVLSLGAVGIQQFRVRTLGIEIAAGREALRRQIESEKTD